MIVKIKKLHPNAVIPTYAKPGDAGMDLTAVADGKYNHEHGFIEFRTGLAFEIPEGYVGLLFPRSSISKQDLFLTNAVGVLDSGYRGEVTFRFKPAERATDNYPFHNDDFVCDRGYDAGDRIGQLIILPHPQITLVEDELSDTKRGEGGFGSSGQ